IASMPPRYAYWTILIDNAPTAFRSRERDELLPTFNRLRRTNKNVIMLWFAHGRLWDSPEEARKRPAPAAEARGRDWRPGGTQPDPRAGSKKKSEQQRRFEPSPPRDTPPAAKPVHGKRPPAPKFFGEKRAPGTNFSREKRPPAAKFSREQRP